MAHLITGYKGEEHIQSADQGSFNAAFFGSGQFVMEIGNRFAASITSNNNVRVLDGDLLMYGRHVRINPNTYEDLTIQTGTAGMNRIDLVVMTYEKNANDGTESAKLEVIKGTEAASDPAIPEYTDGNILEGAIKNQMPLYKVTVEGVVLKSIEAAFKTCPSYAALAEKYEAEFQEACDTYLDSLKILDTKELLDANTQPHQLVDALVVKQIANSAGTWIGTVTIPANSTSAVIANNVITETSVIDMYPKTMSDEKILNEAGVSWVQEAGKVTLTFENATTAECTIQNIVVRNVNGETPAPSKTTVYGSITELETTTFDYSFSGDFAEKTEEG